MSDLDQAQRHVSIHTATAGGLAAILEQAMIAAAGGAAIPVSLNLDYAGPIAPGADLSVEAWIDRATRTLIFAHAEARRADDGARVAVCAGVFRVGG